MLELAARIMVKKRQPRPLRIPKGLFLLCLLQVTSLGAAEAWDESKEVILRGRRLEYLQAGEQLLGEGEVELESAGMRLRADRIRLDLSGNTLWAEGNVVWSDAGNTVWAQSVRLNLKTRQGSAEKLLFRRKQWLAWGEVAEKTGEDLYRLQGCQATSCLLQHPHYRLVAREIQLRLGDRVRLRHVIVYAGVVPLFYLPYYTQSLKDPRPPFEIRPGFQRDTGLYVRTAYNYYFSEAHWGSLRLDWMERKGIGYGLSHHWRLGGGEGEVSGYYTRDKNDPQNQSWNAKLAHRHELGRGYRLLAHGDFISEYQVSEQYSVPKLDLFQNRTWLSLQSSQPEYSWALEASETQVLQPKPGAPPDSSEREYVVSARNLPSLSFSSHSRPLWKGAPLYGSVSGGFSRSLIVPQALGFYDPGKSWWNTQASLAPALSHSLRLPLGASLSSNLSCSQIWTKDEPPAPLASERGVAILSLSETWRQSLGPRLNSDFSWSARRQLTQMETLPYAGLLSHRLDWNLNWNPMPQASLLAAADYDLLPWRTDSDLKRLGLVRLQGSWTFSERRSFSLVSSYHAFTGQLKTLDANLALAGPSRSWQWSAGASWINNRIISQPSRLDPGAPPSFEFEFPRRTPDQLSANWRANLQVTPKLSIAAYQRMNFATKRVEEQALSIWRDLHCWDLELYARETTLSGWQFGFSLTLRALPQVKASSNRIVSDLFEVGEFYD